MRWSLYLHVRTVAGEKLGIGIDVGFCETDRGNRLADSRRDQLQFAVKRAYVADRKNSGKVCLISRVNHDLVLHDIESPLLDRPEAGLKADIDDHRVAGKVFEFFGLGVLKSHTG